MKLIIVDNRMPGQAREKLGDTGPLLELPLSDMVYQAISSHPDIFFCQSDDQLVVSPQLPESVFSKLKACDVRYTVGKSKPGMQYPETATYNAVVTENLVIHRTDCTDPRIREINKNKGWISVKQAYTRCSLVHVGSDRFITSDMGIFNTLEQSGPDLLYVNPDGIRLDGFRHGFFGGCCGFHDNRLYICGSLSQYRDGDAVIRFLEDHGIEYVELYDGPLCDVGSILFLD